MCFSFLGLAKYSIAGTVPCPGWDQLGSVWSGSRKWLRVFSFLIHFMTSCPQTYSLSQVHQNDTLTFRWYGIKTTHTYPHKDTHTQTQIHVVRDKKTHIHFHTNTHTQRRTHTHAHAHTHARTLIKLDGRNQQESSG